jgi:hypothetical protein
LRGLEHAKLFQAAYFLEEWTVLAPAALVYFARAHLEFLLETLGSDAPNEEYVFHWLGSLRQLLHIHERLPFSVDQTSVVTKLVAHILSYVGSTLAFEYFERDIAESAASLLEALGS